VDIDDNLTGSALLFFGIGAAVLAISVLWRFEEAGGREEKGREEEGGEGEEEKKRKSVRQVWSPNKVPHLGCKSRT
jgi:hypothetical protein